MVLKSTVKKDDDWILNEMEYHNNFCLDCKNRIAPKNKSEEAKCKLDLIYPNINIKFDKKLLDTKIIVKKPIDCFKKCAEFTDKHFNNFNVIGDYKKYDNELNTIKRLVTILNGDLGVNQFEGVILDYLRNNTNDRILNNER